MSDATASPADARVRSAALDSAGSLIVQAPAGSGKTSLLVARYLRLLSMARRPEEVVVITFTRKAVEELRGRVLEALSGGEEDAPAAHQRQLAGLARAVRERDAQLDWQLAQAPDRIAVYTIDALCSRIARRMPWLSGLGGGLAIETHASALYREAARGLLAYLDEPGEAGTAVAGVLGSLDGQVPAFVDLIVGMLGRREQWLPLVAAGDREPGALRQLLERGLDAVAEEALQVIARRLPDAQREALGEAVAALVAAGGAAVEPFEALANWRGQAPEALDSLDQWQALAALLLVKKGDALRRSAPAGEAFSGIPAAAAKTLRAAFKAPLTACAAVPGLADAFVGVMALPSRRYRDDEWQLYRDLFQTLKLALAELTVVFAREGRGDFAEVASAAIAALGDPEAPTDLALRLDHRIEHVLVDEFQDTSVTHLALIRALCAGFTEGDGRTLFLVGDPMQSIYRFRQAEVAQFLQCVESGLGQVPLRALHLSVNFRSRPEIVEWLAQTFRQVFPASDDAARSAVAFSPSVAARAPLGRTAVSLSAFEDDVGGQVQGEAVAKEVARIREAYPHEGIAVLVRARSHLPPVIAALEARGLRYRGVEIRALAEVAVVRDLMALTRALSHPMDRVAWLSLLRAPWCGLRLPEVLAVSGQDLEAPLLALLQAPGGLAPLPEEARRRCQRLLAAVLPVVALGTSRSLKRRVEAVWYRLGAPACYPAAAVADAEVFLSLLAELQEQPETLERLAERLDGLYAAPEAGPVDVELMTMHRSKGLEFDHVILPFLERSGRRDDARLLEWSELALRPGHSLALAHQGAGDPRRVAFVRGLEADKATNEACRLLYVACSRAREGLHLMAGLSRTRRGDIATPVAGSLLRRLWGALEEPLLETLVRAEPEQPAAAEVVLTRVQAGWGGPQDTSPTMPPEPTVPEPELLEYEWAGRGARHAGTVVHETLARIAMDGPGAWSEARIDALRDHFSDRLRQLGLETAALPEALERVRRALTGTLADPRGRWILDPSHPQARSEMPLSGWLDRRLVEVVLDRSFVDEEGVRWIIDYKTGIHAGGGLAEFLDREQARYAGQLVRYGRLMASLDARPIRLGLYFPMVAGWRSWALETGS